MDFYDMLVKLQKMYKGKIVMISCGIFYIAVGGNAILINDRLKLKTTCAKKGLCKVGIPKNAIGKYLLILEKYGYGYVVLNYNKEKKELVKMHERDGECIDAYMSNKGCNNCENRKNINLTEYEIVKLPRTEKFSIGTEYKLSIYSMLENTLYIQKIENKEKCLEKINKIDAELNAQRVFLRIMQKQQWIDYNKFSMAMSMIYEMGKMVGGLTKYYAENNKK